MNCFPEKSQDQGTNPIQATKAPASGNATAAAGAKPVGRGNLCLNLTVSINGCPSWKFGALCDLILILLGEKDRDDITVSRNTQKRGHNGRAAVVDDG